MAFLKDAIKNKETIVILKSGIYVPDGSGNYSRAKDRLELKRHDTKVSFPLLPIDLNSLWTVYYSTHEKELEKRIEKETEKISQTNFKENAMNKLFGTNTSYVKLLSTAFFEICPLLRERSESEISDFFDKKKTAETNVWLDYLEEKILKGQKEKIQIKQTGKKTTKNLKQRIEEFEEFAIQQIRGELVYSSNGFAYIDNKAHTLEQVKDNKERDMKIQVENKTYKFGRQTPKKDIINLDVIFERYSELIVETEAEKRLQENMNKKLDEKTLKEMQIIDKILKSGETQFDFGEFGVKVDRTRKEAIIYLHVPQYALKNKVEMRDYQAASYYLLPETDVAIKINSSNYGDAKLIYSTPFLMGYAKSPFISYGEGTNSLICMGYYNVNLEKFNFPLKIAKYLQDAKKVILSGYTGNARPHKRLSYMEESGHIIKISKAELKQRNILITNE